MGRIELDIQWNLYLGDTLRVVSLNRGRAGVC